MLVQLIQITSRPDTLTWKQIAMAFAPGLLTTTLAAYLAVRFALPRFRSERWWERKAQAYTELLSALFHIQRYLEHRIREYEEHTEFDETFMQRLSTAHGEGTSEVRKAAAIGTFLYSEDAAAALTKLRDELDDPHYNDDIHEEIAANLAAVRQALVDIPASAKRDLRLRK